MKVSEDPFVKIKGLIQELIERLLQEEADEADKKDRDYRLRDVADLHTKIEGLNARKDELEQTKGELETALGELEADLAEQTQNRADEKAENERTIAEAKEGQGAVEQATDILSHFYGAAAKATVELAQGVDDDAPDTGFDGAYTGSQSASTGIVGMLDVIRSDFVRTQEETAKDDAQSAEDFLAYER